MRKAIAVLTLGVVIAMTVGTAGTKKFSAQEEPVPKQILQLEHVPDDVWKAYKQLASEHPDWKLKSRFRKADFERVLPGWMASTGRRMTIQTGDFLWDLEEQRLGDNGKAYVISEVEVAEDTSEVQLQVWGANEPLETWSIPWELLGDLQFEYVYCVDVEDPFRKPVKVSVQDASAAEVLQNICEQVGCGYILPDDGTRVRIKIHDGAVSAKDLIEAVVNCVGWSTSNPGLYGPRYTIDKALKEAGEDIPDEGSLVVLFDRWMTGEHFKATSNYTLQVSRPRPRNGR
jgi:hypothetical protein